MCVLSICCALFVDGPSVAYGVIFLETLQSGFALGDLFYLLATGNIFIGYVIDSALSPWVGPILIGGMVAVIVQLFFAYRIWVLSNQKSWWLCLTILFVSPFYFVYCPDTGSQRISLWIVLHHQSNIRDYWECLRGNLPQLCHVYSH